jgi:hypothetical protein
MALQTRPAKATDALPETQKGHVVGWTKAWAKPTQPGNALARVVDDGDPRAKVRNITANRLHGAEFADIAHGAIGLFRSRVALEAEILVLRHQLNVLRRKSPEAIGLRPVAPRGGSGALKRMRRGASHVMSRTTSP